MFSMQNPSLTRLPLCRSFRRPPPKTSPEVAVLLAKYAAHPQRRVSLRTLLSFKPTPESVLVSGGYAVAEIPKRLAARVRNLEALPFLVVSNPYITSTLHAYRESFRWLATYGSITTLEQNREFAEQLEDLIRAHANDVPTMAKGFQECARYLSSEQVLRCVQAVHLFVPPFAYNLLVRLIAEHHVALTHALSNPGDEHVVGVVDKTLSPAAMIKMCGSFVSDLCEATLGTSPEIIVNGHPDATFAYVPVHLEYILTEVLKNSFRASVENHYRIHGTSSTSPVPPVIVTIAPPISGGSFMSLRIRDTGGGVSPANMSKIFSYAFTTAGENGRNDDGGGPYAAQHVGGAAAIGNGGDGAGEGNLFGEITSKGLQMGMGQIAGLGYGLPMASLYTRYFGGSLDLVSMDGWGTDVFLKLRCLDDGADLQI